MKIFICVLAAATIIGGLVGGEMVGNAFLLTGAVIGGIGTGVALLGLGAFFHAQEEKKKKDSVPPEIIKVFDRMLGKETHNRPELSIKSTVAHLFAEDFEILSRGEIPELRLIPHHAIKRDIILLGYTRDFKSLSSEMQSLNKDDFTAKIYSIKRLGPTDLDKVLLLRKKSHNDLGELEAAVRATNSLYKIVDPLFTSP